MVTIAEYCDHNIDPRLAEFSFFGRLFTLGIFFLKMSVEPQIFASFFLKNLDRYIGFYYFPW
jgi:hypothetical protein